MALAGRSARRGGTGFRWVAVGLVVTLFVLLIDASLNSKSVAPGQQLAAGAWYDQVLPLITDSTAEGRQIAGLWSDGLTTSPSVLGSEINALQTSSAQLYQQISRLRPPVDLTGPAGLLEACLDARSQAATALKQAFVDTLGAAYPGVRTGAVPSASTLATGVSPQVQAVQTAQARMELGDQAYQLFLSSLPPHLGLQPFPSSVWLSNAAPYQSDNAEVFLTSLQNSVDTSPVYQVKIYALSTDPAPVTTQGKMEVLPNATSMTLNLVVADVGNQPEPNLTVTASITPSAAGSSSVRDFVSLDAGSTHTILGLGPLNPPQGVPVTLTITVTPPAGSATPVVTDSETFQMPGTTPTTSTTTSTSTTTTTVPGG